MISVTLVNQRIREVHFINNLDKSGQIQLQNNFNFNVEYTANNTHCVAKLYQSARTRDDEDKLFLSAEIIGVFKLEGVVSEAAKKEAHVQCYNQLFPYLQSAVSQLASAAGMPGFMLIKNKVNPDGVVFGKKGHTGEQPPKTLPIV